MRRFEKAAELIERFKGGRYIHGFGVLERAGGVAAALGRRAALVRDAFPGSEDDVERLRGSLRAAGVEIAGVLDGAAPNAPREDLARITGGLIDVQPDVIVSFGGGSTIDAAKAAEVLRTLGGSIDDYFGVGVVTRAGRPLTPHLAIQTAASSAAHLTKYSNITDRASGQKKLIVDEAIVPPRAIFDYGVTLTSPAALTADGALDGLSHCLEVYLGAVGKPHYAAMREVADAAIPLILEYLPRAIRDPRDREAREALGLATDLGGYAIMLGGTNGAHLTSFSLIDILSHGRACAMLNPYYAVFFAPAAEEPLRHVASLCGARADLGGRALGVVVAEALIAFEAGIGFPTRLCDVPGFGPAHIARALAAAKDPQLRMKLENMPVPLRADMVDEYMGPVLEAAACGNLELIRNV
ncbi:MAG: iron-containing alcohol dehydrogenase [Acidobacteriia bacterium]|nr:iron-containing alcohol dehydrogenase [Terriglobia bacterium]